MYDADILATYVEECAEHLEKVEGDLLELEKAPDRVDAEIVNRVFRAAHSIKGGAGFFDLANVRELAHKLENVLDMIRSRAMRPDPEVVNALLNGFDRLRALLADTGSSDAADISEAVVALDGLVVSYLPESQKPVVVEFESFPVPGSDCELKAGALELRRARERGLGIALVRCDLIHDVQRLGKTPLQLLRALDENGAVFDTAVDAAAVGDLDSEEISPALPLYILYGTALPLVAIARVAEIPLLGITMLELPTADPSAAPVAPTVAPSAAPATAAAAPKPSDSPRPAAETASARAASAARPSVARADAGPAAAPEEAAPAQRPADASPDSTVRVSVAVLDRLMNGAGELVLSRNELMEAIDRGDPKAVSRIGRRVDSVTREIQEAVMLTRMQPIGPLFDRFHRVVRDMARKSGKAIGLYIEGRDVEVDRSILELLSDPLTHVIRNACDHGIEAAAARLAAGKGEAGSIRLSARYEGGAVMVEVRDDGKGIDEEAVAAKALRMGLVSAEAVSRLSPKEKAELIMLPGLSTAAEVTEISGRGVGMDVVKANVDSLGGQVEILTERGRGTAIRLRLPLTLAIMPALLVAAGGERFAVPQSGVEEMLAVRAGDVKTRVEKVGDSLVLVLRGKFVPIARLADVLGIPRGYADPETGERRADRRLRLEDRRGGPRPSEGDIQVPRAPGDRRYAAASDLRVVVLGSSGTRYAIVVDEILDTMEIVVKPLGGYFSAQEEYSGATILGDGRVALILDAAGLARKGGFARSSEAEAEDARGAAGGDAGAASAGALLTFRNGPEERLALPLSAVDRVLRISREELSRVGKTWLWTGQGTSAAVLEAAEALDCARILEGSGDLAIVFMGPPWSGAVLAVSPPVDIREAAGELDASAYRGRGVRGGLVVDGKPTLVLDPAAFLREARPAWFEAPGGRPEGPAERAAAPGGEAPDGPGPSRAAETRPAVLVADDSAFFRSRIARLLEEAGYEPRIAEDGAAAWRSFESGGEVAAVVTDLEMPGMDGAQLAARIRGSGSRVPIVALTALASDEDRRRAEEAGVTEFLIKLDEKELVASLARLAGAGRPGGASRGGDTHED